jgi:phosphoribosylaminoimidazole-succinocarboxamide synthase
MTPELIGSGKVREIFRVTDDTLLLVASDRISAYDVVLTSPIPDKGKVLTGLSHFWFSETESICPNHCLAVDQSELPDMSSDDLPGRAMLCRTADPLLIEFVVRGYLAGSGWREYQETRSVCGHDLPTGLVESDPLPQPLLTPATKATSGHDVNITETEAAEIVGKSNYDAGREYALALYKMAAERAAAQGVIIADTKFEFGIADGEVILIDEALTAASGHRTNTSRADLSRHSTSNTSATGSMPLGGTTRRPRPIFPTTWWPAPAVATSTPTNGSPAGVSTHGSNGCLRERRSRGRRQAGPRSGSSLGATRSHAAGGGAVTLRWLRVGAQGGRSS